MARLIDADARDLPERWADVPGYGGRYQASTHGNIRRVNDNGKRVLLKPYRRPDTINDKMFRIRLMDENGKRTEYPLLRIIAKTWYQVPPGMVAIHKNGMFFDNSIGNIRLVPRSEAVRIFAHRHTRKVVCKIDEQGNAVECYASIAEAAAKNFVSAGSVSKQCNGRIKRPVTTGRVMFRFEEDE